MVTALPTFAERKAAGDDHENSTRTKLEEYGWIVGRYGQGILPEAVSDVLRLAETPLRHHPDLIAVRGRTVVAVDCKGTVRGGPHRVSRASIAALRKFGADNDMLVQLVFDDFTVMTPEEAMAAANVQRLGTAAGYLRIQRGLGRPFADVFGRTWPWTEQLRLIA